MSQVTGYRTISCGRLSSVGEFDSEAFFIKLSITWQPRNMVRVIDVQ